MKTEFRKPCAAFYLLLFLLLLILCTRFPYVSDDWYWGSTDDIMSVFNYDNGRYLGNFLGMVAAHHAAFRCLYGAGVLTAIAALCVSLSGKNAGVHTEILLGCSAAILMLSVSRNTFRQTAAWSSAFMIYGTATLLLLTAYKLLRSRSRGKVNALFFILPFAAAFCVENVTIGNLLFISVWILYGLIRGRKPSANEWLYFAGALAGLAVMFSHAGYAAIFAGTSADTARKAETSSLSAMISTALATLKDPMAHLFLGENLVLTVFLTLNLGGLLLFCLPGGKRKYIMLLSYAWILGTTLMLIISKAEPGWLPDLELVRTLSAVLIFGYLFLIPLLTLCSAMTGEEKEGVISLWLCAACLALPLPVAKPLTARTFYPIFSLLMALAVHLFARNLACLREAAPSLCLRARGSVLCMAALTLFVCWGHWFGVYSVIHHYDVERLKFVRTQEEQGIWPALLPRLPYEDYLIVSYPSTNFWMECYQRFNEINLDLKLNVCSFAEWMEMNGKTGGLF